MFGTLSRFCQADSQSQFRLSASLMAVIAPVAVGACALMAETTQARPVIIQQGVYSPPIYSNGGWVHHQAAPASISIGPGVSVRSAPIYFPPSYPSNYGVVGPVYPSRSINNSVLINPTVINSPIRNSTLINPTIIGVPTYPVTNYTTIQTYTRPEPEVVVDPQYGVRYRRPSEY